MKKSKIIKILISSIIALALAIWVYSRWDVWFVSVPESPFVAMSMPNRVTILPGEDFDNSRIVTWRCDSVAHCSYILLVQNRDTIKLEASANLVESRGGKDIFYKVKIENLKNDSTYSYRAVTGDKSSEWYSFKMPSKEGLKNFLYIGDVQDTIGGISKSVFQNIKEHNPDAQAWIFGGDLVDLPVDAHWNFVWNNLSGIAGDVPFIGIAGNHEYIKSTIPYLDKRWENTFAYDSNGASDCEGTYYIESKEALIISLNTHSFMRGTTIINQYNWLKDVVMSHGEGKWKILVMHHPMKSVRKGKSHFWEKNLFGPLVKLLGINVVLQGHEHGYSRKVEDNTLYIVSHCSSKHYTTEKEIADTKIIGDTRMYQRFELSNDTLSYSAYNAISGEKMDSIILTK